ncbi:MAG: xylulokinase [Clostridia bacterium]|nr:xylulokinase [Clostridia bacterium]
MQVVLGADVGTHGVRIVALNTKNQIAASGSRDYQRRQSHGRQEQEAGDWWQAFLLALKDTLAQLPPGAELLGLGVTHQRGTVVPVDGQGTPVRLALCDSDERSAAVLDEIKEVCGAQRYYNTTGCPVVPFNGLTKILWCKKNEPEVFARARYWLSPQDYILTKLGGRPAGSQGSALRNGVLDIRHWSLAADLLKELGLSERLFPPLVPTGREAGRVSREAARAASLPAGLPLIAVPGDQPCAVIASGALARDSLAINLGSSFVVSKILTHPTFDPQCLATLEIVTGDLYALEFGTGAGGLFIDWFMKLTHKGLLPREKEVWQEFDQIAGTIAPGAEGLRVVPLLWHALLPGACNGIYNIKEWHGQGHLFRAVLEGLAMEARLAVDRLEDISGVKAAAIRVFGGGSQLETLLVILAAATNTRVVTTSCHQMSALGAALVTATSLGVYPGLAEAVQVFVREEKPFIPRPPEVDFYRGFYNLYREERERYGGGARCG